MKIILATNVSTSYQQVFEGFDLKLFKALKPPLTGLEVKRFDGCSKGDEVHLEVSILGQKKKWVSLITEDQQNEQEIYFIDEGRVLPPPLAFWKHKHRIIRRTQDKSTIIDEIEFRTHSKVMDAIIYPALYAQFRLRKPVYRKFFGKA
jgi:ligand-binding SRPBCC domain-containing protein